MLLASPYEPLKLILDTTEINASQESDVIMNSDLKNVTVPVFYVGGAGGFGELGNCNSLLLGSGDQSNLVIALKPAEQAAVDFGHVDLFSAESARTLVWDPISQWIQSH